MKKSARLIPVLNSMVLQNTFGKAVAIPTEKRDFVTLKFCEVVFCYPIMVKGGMADAVTPGAWLYPCFEHPVRPTCFKTRQAVPLSRKGAKTMNKPFTPTQAAPTLASAIQEAELVELHFTAHNAATLAKFYTARHKYEAAARKTRQHLAALRQISKLQKEAACA